MEKKQQPPDCVQAKHYLQAARMAAERGRLGSPAQADVPQAVQEAAMKPGQGTALAADPAHPAQPTAKAAAAAAGAEVVGKRLSGLTSSPAGKGEAGIDTAADEGVQAAHGVMALAGTWWWAGASGLHCLPACTLLHSHLYWPPRMLPFLFCSRYPANTSLITFTLCSSRSLASDVQQPTAAFYI